MLLLFFCLFVLTLYIVDRWPMLLIELYIVIKVVPYASYCRRRPEWSLIIWTVSPGFGRFRHPPWKSHISKGASLIFSACQRLVWPELFLKYMFKVNGFDPNLLFAKILKKCFYSRLWQMKEVLRWFARNGVGLVWPRGLAILQARTLVLCCARTMRGSSTLLKCSSLVPACRYHYTFLFLLFKLLGVISK